VAALAEGAVLSESMARALCGWTDKLPEDCRGTADEILLAAARAGARKEDLAALAAEIYARSLPDGDDDEPKFEDRQLRVETTFAGAGVISGDLTPECAAVVTAVLEALSAPKGAEDTRTREQRYHDALQDAMLGPGAPRIVRAGLPDRGALLVAEGLPCAATVRARPVRLSRRRCRQSLMRVQPVMRTSPVAYVVPSSGPGRAPARARCRLFPRVRSVRRTGRPAIGRGRIRPVRGLDRAAGGFIEPGAGTWRTPRQQRRRPRRSGGSRGRIPAGRGLVPS
jgi:Domain of unknown function (DUF222)